MPDAIHFPQEERSNATRDLLHDAEPHSLRTFTPSQAVFGKSAGVFHWTLEGRRLYDFSSGVLVSNLGHNPRRWLQRLFSYMAWTPDLFAGDANSGSGVPDGYFPSVPLTAYNAMTGIEGQASARLLANLRRSPLGSKMEQVVWSASGSEAVQKALWACLGRDSSRDLILATRFGFHGKKGLAGAVTGSEKDKNRDPRVKFIAFPMEECDDLERSGGPFDPTPYEAEWEKLRAEHGRRINCVITEPYLGGGGSYHPPREYHQRLERWCRSHDVLLIFDEVQANFGRTGEMYAFEAYGVTPDFVCLGKGLGNGIPVSAAAGRRDILELMGYGETSDTWSANPLSCAAVLATLDEFESTDVLDRTRELSRQFVQGLLKLKRTGIVAKVRGEGMVFGIECGPVGNRTPAEVANALVKTCYLGDDGGDGIHLLGPLAGKVVRVSPPMTMTRQEAEHSLDLLLRFAERTAAQLATERPATA